MSRGEFRLFSYKDIVENLAWPVFFSGFMLVLLPQQQLLYVPIVLTALGIFYLGFESYRLRGESGSSYAKARTMIRSGFVFLTASAVISFTINISLLTASNMASSLYLILSIASGPLWVVGTLVAFGGVAYSRRSASASK